MRRHPHSPTYGLIVAVLALALALAFPAPAAAYRAQAEKLVEAGLKLLDMKRVEEAEQKFTEARDEDPTFAPPYYNLAVIARDRGNFEEARLNVDKALKNSPHEGAYKLFLADLNVQLASNALKEGNAKEALDYWEKNRSLVAFHLPTMNRLAGYYVSIEDFEKAKAVANEALTKLQSSDQRWAEAEIAVLHANLAICYYKTKDLTRAMSEIRMAKGKKEDLDIVKRYYKIIFSEDNPVIANMKKGDAAYELKNFDEALGFYKEVLKVYPTYSQAIEKKSAIENRFKIEDLHTVAEDLMQKEDFQKAEAAFTQILAYDTNDAKAKAGLAEIAKRLEKKEAQMIMGRSEAARGNETDAEKAEKLAALAKMQSKEVDPEKAAEIEYLAACDKYDNKKWDEALEAFLTIRSKNPAYKDVTAKIAAVHRERGEIYLESFDQAFPKWYFYAFGALVVLGIIWYFMAEQVTQWMTPDPRRFFKRATDLMERGKHKAALKQFAKAEAHAVGPQEVLKIKEKMVQCHFAAKNHSECVKLGKEVLDRDPRNDRVITIVGEAYLDLNMTSEDALNVYRRMFRIKKDDSRLLNILCMTYVSDGNLSSEAVEVYEKAFIKNPADKSIRSLLCEAYVRANNRNEGAIRVYESALEDDPKKRDVRTMLITAYFTRNKYDKAIHHCMVLFDQGIFDEMAFDYLKNSYKKSGKQAEMAATMRKLYERFPDEEILKASVDRAEVDMDVARLTGRDNAAAAEDAAGPKICGNCAHINPPTHTKCETCGTPL